MGLTLQERKEKEEHELLVVSTISLQIFWTAFWQTVAPYIMDIQETQTRSPAVKITHLPLFGEFVGIEEMDQALTVWTAFAVSFEVMNEKIFKRGSTALSSMSVLHDIAATIFFSKNFFS